MAVNFGDDADTTGAIYGQIARILWRGKVTVFLGVKNRYA
ncbi:MAG TPA: ADP-ribosylglycohydrolase family protein [Syntrophales bacterium]|nr:ADP-ribosylglycohydrolase family protein [Syntrophales bacterium]